MIPIYSVLVGSEVNSCWSSMIDRYSSHAGSLGMCTQPLWVAIGMCTQPLWVAIGMCTHHHYVLLVFGGALSALGSLHPHALVLVFTDPRSWYIRRSLCPFPLLLLIIVHMCIECL